VEGEEEPFASLRNLDREIRVEERKVILNSHLPSRF